MIHDVRAWRRRCRHKHAKPRMLCSLGLEETKWPEALAACGAGASCTAASPSKKPCPPLIKTQASFEQLLSLWKAVRQCRHAGAVKLVELQGYLTPQLLSLSFLVLHRLLFHAKALHHTTCFACHLVNQAALLVILLPACTYRLQGSMVNSRCPYCLQGVYDGHPDTIMEGLCTSVLRVLASTTSLQYMYLSGLHALLHCVKG